jgi:hypothetical protein
MRWWVYEVHAIEKRGGGEGGREACLENERGRFGFENGKEEQDDT